MTANRQSRFRKLAAVAASAVVAVAIGASALASPAKADTTLIISLGNLLSRPAPLVVMPAPAPVPVQWVAPRTAPPRAQPVKAQVRSAHQYRHGQPQSAHAAPPVPQGRR